MKDARKQIVKALIDAIAVKIPGITCFTIKPKVVDGGNASYPYIYISDIYQLENGQKTNFMYNYEVLIQIVHKELNTKLNLYSQMSEVVAIIANKRDISLGTEFNLMQIRLVSSSESEILTDTGTLHLGLVRFSLDIEHL